MPDNGEFNRRVRLTAFVTVALVAALIFGIAVLVSGDWLPGTITVAAAIVGLVREIPVIARLCSGGRSPSPPRHRPAR